jgi:hypothetical protein
MHEINPIFAFVKANRNNLGKILFTNVGINGILA